MSPFVDAGESFSLDEDARVSGHDLMWYTYTCEMNEL